MSFANELRDFLASYTAITEMGDKRKTRAADREYRDAMLDLQRQRVDMERERLRNSGSERVRDRIASDRLALDREKFEFDRDQKTRERNAERFRAMADNFGAQDTAARGAGAGAGGFNAADYYSPDDEDDDFVFARGGMVPRPAYNRGGMVDDEPDSELVQRGSELSGIPAFVPGQPYPPPQATPLGAQPTPAPQATPLGAQPTPAPQAVPAGPAPAPEPERPEINPEASRIVVSRAAEAADAAARSFSVDIERPRAAVGEGSDAPETDVVNNRGGLSMEEYEEVLRKVDPNGAMPAHLQSAAVLAEGYRFFQEQGDLPRAETFARRILITQKAMSQTLGTLSLQALENGDLQNACRLFNDACNKFPSGHEIEVRPDERRGLIYRVSNNGEVVDQGRLNTEQFWELATGVSNGSAFLREVAQFASEERPRARTPADLRNGAVSAYQESVQANEALQTLLDATKTSPDALREAQERAQQANAAAAAAINQALSGGVSDSALNAALRRGQAIAVPEVPESRLEKKPPGPISRFFFGDPDYTPPAPAEGGDPSSMDAAIPTGPAAPAVPAAPVTPQGNNPPPAPRSAADRVVGQTYTAPDGRRVIWRGTGWEVAR